MNVPCASLRVSGNCDAPRGRGGVMETVRIPPASPALVAPTEATESEANREGIRNAALQGCLTRPPYEAEVISVPVGLAARGVVAAVDCHPSPGEVESSSVGCQLKGRPTASHRAKPRHEHSTATCSIVATSGTVQVTMPTTVRRFPLYVRFVIGSACYQTGSLASAE